MPLKKLQTVVETTLYHQFMAFAAVQGITPSKLLHEIIALSLVDQPATEVALSQAGKGNRTETVQSTSQYTATSQYTVIAQYIPAGWSITTTLSPPKSAANQDGSSSQSHQQGGAD